MFLLRSRNNLNEKKQHQHQQRVLKYSCLYIASVELFLEIGPDQTAMKRTIERTAGNLDLKTVSGDSVTLIINQNGIVIQDARNESLIMAHALKRICFTTSFPKKKLYMFVSRLPQQERIFAHFFLMHDKSSGQKITQELAKAFTHAYKERKKRTIQRDHRRSVRAQSQPLNSQPQPQPPKVPQHKQKAHSRPISESHLPPAYADQVIPDEEFLPAFDTASPAHVPSAPPIPFETAPYNPPLSPNYPFSQVQLYPPPSQQPPLNNGSHAPALLQAEPQPVNSFLQDPFSPFHTAHTQQTPDSLDGLPSYNSAIDPTFQQQRRISNDDILIDLNSPDPIQTPTNLFRSLSTSNMLDDLRNPTPPPPPFQEIHAQPQPEPQDPYRSRLGAQPELFSRPKSGIYPALSYGMEQHGASQEPLYETDTAQFMEQGYQAEKHELASEPWFQPGLPRDIIVEILMSQKEGSFFIRESSSQPGKLVISVRGSTNVTHYLIVKSKKGYHVESEKLFFPSLSFLVMHHSINRGLLPCTLTVADTNPTYLRADHLESSDSEAEGEDPIYTTYAVTDSMKLH